MLNKKVNPSERYKSLIIGFSILVVLFVISLSYSLISKGQHEITFNEITYIISLVITTIADVISIILYKKSKKNESSNNDSTINESIDNQNDSNGQN